MRNLLNWSWSPVLPTSNLSFHHFLFQLWLLQVYMKLRRINCCEFSRKTFGWNIHDMRVWTPHFTATRSALKKNLYPNSHPNWNTFPTWWKLLKKRMLSPLPRWRHTRRDSNRCKPLCISPTFEQHHHDMSSSWR